MAEATVSAAQLKFWFGPFKIAAPRLNVLREKSRTEPASRNPLPPPDAASLPKGAVGYYRCEPSTEKPLLLSRSGGFLRYVEKSYERRFLDLTGDFDGYLAKFSGKTRATLKRKVRRFAEFSGGRIDWRMYRTPDEMTEFQAYARTVAEVSYQERLFDAAIPADVHFLAQMRALAAQDLIRAYVLFHNGRAVSYLYCPAADGRLEYGYLGFRPEYAKHSPGTVLQYLALEQLFSEGSFRIFDFTEGDGEHKRLFSTYSVPCADVFYLVPSMRTLLLVHCHRLVSRASELADTLVERMGIRVRLRKMLRGVSEERGAEQ